MKLLTLFFLLVACPVFAAVPAGQVILASGKIQAISPNNASRTLQRGTPFFENDTLVTARNAHAKLRFSDGTLMTLSPDTRIRVDKYRYKTGEAAANNSYVITLAIGGFRTVSGAIAQHDPKAYAVRTPVATIAVRGTDYSVIYKKTCRKEGSDKTCGLVTAVWDGTIALTNDGGILLLGGKQGFQYARVQSGFLMPEGLTDLPDALAKNPFIGAPLSSHEATQSGSGKGPLLQICFP
ncbi:MAG: FecR domain-containing protein [Gammaproteobacteria bacterium]